MSRKTLLVLRLATAIALLACLSGRSDAEGPEWIRDFDKGKEQVRAEGKALFILFTGHWNAHKWASCIENNMRFGAVRYPDMNVGATTGCAGEAV